MRRQYCFAVDHVALGRGYSAGMEEPAQEQHHFVHIRPKVLLSKILRGIDANEAQYNCRAMTNGYVGFAETSVYGARAGAEPLLVRTQGIPAIRPSDALISVIKKECRVEVVDANWFDMNCYHGETEQLNRALGRVRKKHNTLAKKAHLLEIGWDRALDSLASVNQICDDICSSALGGIDADA